MGGLCGKGVCGKKNSSKHQKTTLSVWQSLYDIHIDCCRVPAGEVLGKRTNGIQGCSHVVIVKISIDQETTNPISPKSHCVLRMPVIDWGNLDVKMQFPPFLPMNIWPGEKYLFALINPDAQLPRVTKVKLTGLVGNEELCLEQEVNERTSYDALQWRDIAETLKHEICQHRIKPDELSVEKRTSAEMNYLMQWGDMGTMHRSMGEVVTETYKRNVEASVVPEESASIRSIDAVEDPSLNKMNAAQKAIRVREYTGDCVVTDPSPDPRAISPDGLNRTPGRVESPSLDQSRRSKLSVHSLCDYMDSQKSGRTSVTSLTGQVKDTIPAVDGPDTEGSFTSLCVDTLQRVSTDQSISPRSAELATDSLPVLRERADTAPSGNKAAQGRASPDCRVPRSTSVNGAMSKRRSPTRQRGPTDRLLPTPSSLAADSTASPHQSNVKLSPGGDGEKELGTKEYNNTATVQAGGRQSIQATPQTKQAVYPVNEASAANEATGPDADDKFDSETSASEATIEYRQKANSMSYTKRYPRKKVARATSLVQCSKINAATNEVQKTSLNKLTPPPFEAFIESQSRKSSKCVQFTQVDEGNMH